MNKTVGWTIAVIVILVVIGAVVYWQMAVPATSSPAQSAATNSTRTAAAGGQVAVTSATYTCDKGHTIQATFFQGPSAQAQPGQPPVPNGTVTVSLDGGASTSLTETISADGARYSDGNPQIVQGQPGAETFVFWSKGNTALVMKNNAQDLTYTNCSTTAQAQ